MSNILLNIESKADFTSPSVGPLRSRRTDDYPVNIRVFIWGDFGASGTATVEIKMPNGSWVDFPELVFDTDTAQSVQLFEECEVRVVIAGAVSVNAVIGG